MSKIAGVLVLVILSAIVGAQWPKEAEAQSWPFVINGGLVPWPTEAADIVNIHQVPRLVFSGEIVAVYQVPSGRWLLVQEAVYRGQTPHFFQLVENNGGIRTVKDAKPYNSQTEGVLFMPEFGRVLAFAPGSTVEIENADPNINATGTWDVHGYLVDD